MFCGLWSFGCRYISHPLTILSVGGTWSSCVIQHSYFKVEILWKLVPMWFPYSSFKMKQLPFRLRISHLSLLLSFLFLNFSTMLWFIPFLLLLGRIWQLPLVYSTIFDSCHPKTLQHFKYSLFFGINDMPNNILPPSWLMILVRFCLQNWLLDVLTQLQWIPNLSWQLCLRNRFHTSPDHFWAS